MANTTVQTGNNAPANVRASKSTQSECLGTISNGTTVDVVRCNDTWATLLFEGTPAFIWNSLLTNPPTQNGAGLSSTTGSNTAKCNGSDVNVRANAVNGNVVGTLNKGDFVTVSSLTTGTDGYVWYNIGSGRWVRGDYLTPASNDAGGSTTPSDINVGDTIITILPGVNFRSSPAGSSLFQVSTGTTMVVTAITSANGYTWYKGTISGSTGYLRGDCVEKHSSGSGGGNSYSNGNFIRLTGNGVNVRRTASSSQYGAIGSLRSGTKLICEGTSGSFVKVKWGGTTYASAYLHKDYVSDTGNMPSDKKAAAVAIALSMEDKGYTAASNFGLTSDEWCVQWISFLMKASGCSQYPDFSAQGTVQRAMNFFGSNYGSKSTKSPKVGDWVFYTTTGSTVSEPKKYYAHVGFVVDVKSDGRTIRTVEGNLDNTVTSPGEYDYITDTHIGNNNFSVLGFATPNW